MSDKNVVNVEYLADRYGVDVRTIQNYAKYNGMPKQERGEYPLVECDNWMIDRLKTEIEHLKSDTEKPINQERLENLKHNNRRKEIENKQLMGELLDKNDVIIKTVNIIKMLMRNADAIPARLNKRINGDAKTLAAIRDEITVYKNTCAGTPVEEMINENEFEED